jgi:hypothetical protein
MNLWPYRYTKKLLRHLKRGKKSWIKALVAMPEGLITI